MADLKEFRVTLKTLLKHDTLAFKAIIDAPPTMLEKLSEKARNVHSAITKHEFGCSRESIRALASVLLGEELPPVKQDDKWLFEGCRCIVIKMLVNGNDSFAKGRVLARLPGYKYDDKQCYKKAFMTDKAAPSNAATFKNRSDFEFATDAEIDTYVDGLPDVEIQGMTETVIFM